MFRFIVYGIFLLLLGVGCQKVFDFPEAGEYKKNPIIEAIITDKPNHQSVRVSYSTTFNDSLSSEPVSTAVVKILDSNGDTIGFQYSDKGWYICEGLVAFPENNYTLLVQVDSTIYSATSVMLPTHELDSLSYSFYKKVNTTDSAYYVKFYAGITDPNNPKYYQLQVYQNHKIVTSGINTSILTDIATLSLNGIEIEQPFSKSDTIDVELYSLTREMFYYYVYIFNTILYNSNYNLDFKTNPPTQFTPVALGYFQVSALSQKRIIIK